MGRKIFNSKTFFFKNVYEKFLEASRKVLKYENSILKTTLYHVLLIGLSYLIKLFMPAKVVIACVNKVWKKDRPWPHSDNPVLNEVREICEREKRKSPIIILVLYIPQLRR